MHEVGSGAGDAGPEAGSVSSERDYATVSAAHGK